MDMGILHLLVFGTVAVLAAAGLLAGMVHYELRQLAGLPGRGPWLLAAGLGTGVVAFALKLGLILAITHFPRADAALAPAVAVALPTAAPSRPPTYRWEPLNELPARTAVAAPTEAYPWQALPRQAPAPEDNPPSADKVALGRKLFFDTRLSRDGTLACASCHDLGPGAGADRRPTARGIDGQLGARNTPTVFNAAFQAVLFWDGRAASLEEQAKGPLINPAEMGMPSLEAVERRVAEEPEYRAEFARAFGPERGITIDLIAAALASYERTLITPDAPFDRFVRGDLDALTPAQLRGMRLFQAVGCVNCHSGPNFSAASLFDGRAPLRSFPANPTPDETRLRLTLDTGGAPAESGRGVWRIPSLRNVALTGPWFHNGSVESLEEAVRVMSRAQLGRLGPMLIWSSEGTFVKSETPALSDEEVADIVAFLNALSSDALAAARGASEGVAAVP